MDVTKSLLSTWSQVSESYDHLTRHIVAGPRSVYYFIPILLLIFALLTPPSTLSTAQLRSIILPLSCSCFVYYSYVEGGFDVILADAVLWTLALIGYHDARRDFRRLHILGDGDVRSNEVIRDPKEYSQQPTQSRQLAKIHSEVPNQRYQEHSYPSTFSDRLPWVLDLVGTSQLHNWKTGERSHDAHQPGPVRDRSAYTRMIVMGLLRTYLFIDTTSYLEQFDPYFHSLSTSFLDVQSHPWYHVLSQYHLAPLLIVFRSLLLQLQLYASCAMYNFYIPMGVFLLVGCVIPLSADWSPWRWPSHFGPISSVWDLGLRGFWGTWWHQQMRRIVTPPGMLVANWLGLGKRSTMRYAVISASAFFFSGIVHMGLVPPEPQYADMSALSLRFSIAGFFWAQWPAVILEVVVARVANRYFSADFLESRMRKTMTFTWVVLCFSIVFPLWSTAGKQLGHFRPWAVPFSLWNGLSEGRWFMWA